MDTQQKAKNAPGGGQGGPNPGASEGGRRGQRRAALEQFVTGGLGLLFRCCCYGPQCKAEGTSPDQPGGGSKRTEGYLCKYANFAEGYKRRWFVLEDSQFAYYRSQGEYPVNCRGSINIAFLRTVPQNQDKCRFDIVGTTSSAIRMHLRADSPAEANRWIQAINQEKSLQREHRLSNECKPVDMMVMGSYNNAKNAGAERQLPAGGTNSKMEELVRIALMQLQLQEGIMSNLYDGLPPASIQEHDEEFKVSQQLIDQVRDALLGCQQAEVKLMESLQSEQSHRLLLEDALKAMAVENSRMEAVIKYHEQMQPQRAATMPGGGGQREEEEMFYDVEELDLEGIEYRLAQLKHSASGRALEGGAEGAALEDAASSTCTLSHVQQEEGGRPRCPGSCWTTFPGTKGSSSRATGPPSPPTPAPCPP